MEVPKAIICMRLKLLLQYTEKPKTMIQLFIFGLYSLFIPDNCCRKLENNNTQISFIH